jgi:hypothetical protein
MVRRVIGIITLVLAAFVLWPTDAAFATPISVFTSNSSIRTFRFPPQSDFDSFGPADPCAGMLRGCIDSTHADLNGSHISSFSEFGNGFMGARFDSSGSNVPLSANTQSSFSTSWYCVVCGAGTVGTPDGSEFVPLHVLLSITGSAADVGQGFVELTASLSLTNGTVMRFDYSQDDSDPAGATMDVGQGTIPVNLTFDPVTNIWNFSINADVTALVCGPDFPCQPATAPCFSTDTCTGIPSFTATQSISLLYDDNGNGNPFFLDASDPFGVQFVSGDPNFQFASSDGQSTGPLGPAPIVATPEPATLTLMLGGVAGILRVRRRRDSV